MRRLNGYLKRDPGSLQPEERDEMISLAEAAGVDLTGILMKTRRSGFPSDLPREEETYLPPPPPPVTTEACAADADFSSKAARQLIVLKSDSLR